MSQTRAGRTVGAAVVALVAIVAIAGFLIVRGGTDGGGNGSGDGGRGGGGATTTQRAGARADALAARILAVADEEPVSVAGAEGTVRTFDGDATARVDVISVEVDDRGTVVTWRIASTSGPLRLRPNTFHEGDGVNVSGVGLVDVGANTLARPYRFSAKYRQRCVCSETPRVVDADGQLLSGLYPPLPPQTATVQLRVPGFPPIDGLPVTRR